MKVGELFVDLGVKGSDSAVKAVSNVRSGMGEVKSVSLEAKAAILAVVYGLEQMMSQSAKMGTSLLNFTTLTGISAKELQQWQYAAQQAGVSGEEMTGSLKAVQAAMTNMLLGKGAPEGMAMLANKVGFDPARARDTLYVMGQLQKFAQTVPVDVGNAMLKSFGLSEGTVAAMRRNMFTEDNFKKAPLVSDNEIKALNKVDVAWQNLGTKIKMAMAHLTAREGLQIIGEITKATVEVLKLVQALTVLAEKIKIFAFIGKVAEGIGDLANITALGVDEIVGTPEQKAAAQKKEKDFLKRDITPWDNQIKSFFQNSINGVDVQRANQHAPGNVEINQNLNFQHDGKDHKKTSDSVHKAVKDAYRQMQAQSQGT